jgi:hypothetical protein
MLASRRLDPFHHVLKDRLEFPQVLPGGGMDDYCFAAAGTFNLADAVPQSLQPSPDLRGAQLDMQTVAFDPGHFCPRFRATADCSELGKQASSLVSSALRRSIAFKRVFNFRASLLMSASSFSSFFLWSWSFPLFAVTRGFDLVPQ